MKKITSYRWSQLTYLALLASLLVSSVCLGQSVNTNSGKDFWFGFTETSDGVNASYVVYITALKATSGTVSIPGSAWSTNFNVVPATPTRIVLPSADVVVTSFTGPVNQAVNVIADSNISVFAAIEYSERSDNSCILPVPLLGDKYYLIDYALCQSFSQFMIVAQSCKDSVEIIPSKNITVGGNHPEGIPYTEVLNPGQVFLVQCDSDLTGSMVRSLNHSETAVFAGANWNCVACGGTANPFYEEIFPSNTWGKSYVFLPTAQAEDQCRVLSEQNGTTVKFVTVAGTNTQTLNAGQYYDTAINYSAPVYISANNPVSVGRFLITGSCNEYYVNNPTNKGDPSEARVESDEQMLLDTISFYVSRKPDIDSTYLQVVTRTPDANSVFLDNVNIGSYFNTLLANPAYSYASLTIMPGAHTLTTSGQGFDAYSCGLGYLDAMACDAGVYLNNINIVATYTPPGTCLSSDATATVSATGDAPFSYLWSNGKTTQTITGLSAGIYTITVSDSDCVPHKATAVVNISGKPGYAATVTDSNPGCKDTLGMSKAFPTGGTAPYTYSWSNGETTQTATGLSSGTYTCTITDNTGCKCFVIASIAGFTQPAIGISPYNDSVCGDTSMSLHVFGLNTNVYNWAPNKGLSCYNCPSPIASPTITTTYTITGQDSNGCTASTTLTITVLSATPAITAGKDSVCAGYSDTLNVIGGNTYVWSNGSTTSSIIVSPAFTTTYTVTAYKGYCPARDTTFTVTVVQPPALSISALQDTVCQGDSVQLKASGSVKYKWSTGSTAGSIWVKPITQTTYTVFGFAGTCSDSVSKTIYVRPLPTFNIKLLNDSICPSGNAYLVASGGTTYKWSPGGATTDSIKISPGTTTKYSVIIADPCGSDTLSETVHVIPAPAITLSGNTTICAGKSTIINASGGSSYSWNPSGGLSCNNCPDPTASPTVTTTYTLTVSNGKCVSDSVVTITVNNLPLIQLTQPQDICPGLSVTLTASGGGTYLWSNGATTSSITVSPTSATSYTVVVNNGCIDSASTSVVVDTPKMFVCCDTTIMRGDTANIHTTGQGNYVWTPPNGLSCYTCPDPVATPTVTTTYTVAYTDSAGCPEERTVTIRVEIPCADFIVPNVFTPNDDGINDDFVIKVLNDSSYSIVIYDRWGKEVYSSADITKYWNGRYNGTNYLVPDGVYYYIIKATCGSNNYVKKGFVQVLGEK